MTKETQSITLYDDRKNEFTASFTTSLINGRIEVTGVSINSVDDNAIVSQKFLRSLPVASVTRSMRHSELSSDSRLEPVTAKKWTGTDEQLKLVAELYREAYRMGVPVQPYLAQKTGRPVTTVNRWVRQARNKGHLGKANSTRAGEW